MYARALTGLLLLASLTGCSRPLESLPPATLPAAALPATATVGPPATLSLKERRAWWVAHNREQRRIAAQQQAQEQAMRDVQARNFHAQMQALEFQQQQAARNQKQRARLAASRAPATAAPATSTVVSATYASPSYPTAVQPAPIQTTEKQRDALALVSALDFVDGVFLETVDKLIGMSNRSEGKVIIAEFLLRASRAEAGVDALLARGGVTRDTAPVDIQHGIRAVARFNNAGRCLDNYLSTADESWLTQAASEREAARAERAALVRLSRQ